MHAATMNEISRSTPFDRMEPPLTSHFPSGTFSTERLILDRPTPADIEDIVEIHTDPRTNIHNPAGPSSREQCEERLAGWLRDWEMDGHGVWVVREAVDGPVIGAGGISRKTLRGHAVWNLYYRFRPSAWGRGYATELARYAVALPDSIVGGIPIVAIVRPTNTESARVAVKAGLTLIGRVPYGGADSDVYSSHSFDLHSGTDRNATDPTNYGPPK